MKPQFVRLPEMAVSKKTIRPGKIRRTVTTTSETVYRSAYLIGDLTIGQGFVSDGASVPQFLWDRFPPFGLYLESAIVHDYFCDLGKVNASPIDYKTAALIFREAMKVQGVGRIKRNTMYQAVRWFGPKFKASNRHYI